MKIFSSEVGHNYGSYTFAYALYAEREPGDSLTEIYAKGYLPYSGSRKVKDVFYMARSARVVLKEFELLSENRRIAKKFDGEFKKERIPLSDFTITEEFLNFCLSYFAEKHGERAMPRERLQHILEAGVITDIVAYSRGDTPVAYVFEANEDDMGHYWFSFYDLSLAKQSLGLWLMLDCLRDAKEKKLSHYYLGTVYGEKALYKTNFEPLEWWDGTMWSTDIKLLKARGRSDNERSTTLKDAWKEDQELF